MSTSVSVHAHLPGGSRSSIPAAIVELVQSVGQPPPYSAGEMTIPRCPQVIRVLQVQVRGRNRLDVGKNLVAEIKGIGFEARMLVHHSSSRVSTSAWWPGPPSWPTWEWPIERVREWLKIHENDA